MTNTDEAAPSYWFGRREQRLFLFDRTFQPDDEEDAFFWEIGPKQIRFFKRNIAQASIKKLVPDFDTAEAIACYEDWRKSEGKRYLLQHNQLGERVINIAVQNREAQLEERRETSATAETFHRFVLSKLLKSYPGVDAPSDSTELRYSVCWSCRKEVDSTMNPTCRRCGWIVCTCGSCKCSIPE